MVNAAVASRVVLTDRLAFMTADEAVQMVRELCVPLGSDEYSLHGNIWPGNIQFDEDGKALLGEPSDKSAARRDAAQVEYLAPEYFWTDEGSAATDVYSLGLLLYAACNDGYLPFQPKGGTLTEKDRAAALRKRMKGEHIPMPIGMSEELSTIVRRALAYREEQRYVSAAELLAALNRTDEALPTMGKVISITEKTADKPASQAAPGRERKPEAAKASRAEKSSEAEKKPEAGGVPEAEKKPGSRRSPRRDKPEAGKKEKEEKKPQPAKMQEAKKLPQKTGKEKRPEETPAKPRPEERKYTVQKDFERKARIQKAMSAAPATRRRKKRTSPAVMLLSLVAVGVLAAAGAKFLLPNRLAPQDMPAEAGDRLPAEAPVASAAPEPLAAAAAAAPEGEQQPNASGAEPAEDEITLTPVDDTVYAADSGVSLRIGPGTSYTTAQSLSRGTELHRTAVVGGWSRVEYEGAEYYVSSALISIVPPEDPEALDTPATGGEEAQPAAEEASGSAVTTVTVRSSANLRTGPGTSNAVVATVDAGTVLEYTGQENGWYCVLYGGKEVYISNKLVSEGGELSEVTPGDNSVGTLTVLLAANIRAGAGTDSAVIGQVEPGETLSVIGFTPPKWYRVSFNGQEGYINCNMVDAGDLALENGMNAKVQVTSAAHLRAGPGTDYQILGTAQAGDTLTVTGNSNGWYQVNYNGSTAYISGNFAQ